jgi:hypothetical protein
MRPSRRRTVPAPGEGSPDRHRSYFESARYGPKTAVEGALTGIPSIEQAFIGGSWAARYHGQAGAFPNDVDVIVVGKPNRDDVTEAVIEALRVVGHDGQVIFRSPTAWREAKDAFTRTAKDSPLVELTIGNADG